MIIFFWGRYLVSVEGSENEKTALGFCGGFDRLGKAAYPNPRSSSGFLHHSRS